MGAGAGRLLRRFNVESRAHREINKNKPEPAPRHETHKTGPVVSEEVHLRDDPLLVRLKQIYVDSKDPVKQAAVAELRKVERRPVRCSFPGGGLGMGEISEVPVGKLSILEALTALNDHKRSPRTWTSQKIAQEFLLNPQDAAALTQFFIPFDVKILAPGSGEKKRIKSP